MGRKKKSFIDKKNSSTYHLLHRSQRDVTGDLLSAIQEDQQGGGGEEGEEDNNNNAIISQQNMILWPSPNNSAKTDSAILQKQMVMTTNTTATTTTTNAAVDTTMMDTWRKKLSDVGLLDEGPERYMKEISGSGTFVDAGAAGGGGGGGGMLARRSNGKGRCNQQHHHGATRGGELLEDDDDGSHSISATMEVDRQFDSIPLTSEYMDDDIAKILFDDEHDFDAVQYEELNDDFVFMAAADVHPDEQADEHHDRDGGGNDSSRTAAFDYDEHIRKLLERARRERDDQPTMSTSLPSHTWAHRDRALFDGLRPLNERSNDDDEDDNDDESHHNNNDELRSVISSSCETTTSTWGGYSKSSNRHNHRPLTEDEERVLCEQFEETLAEYDSDEVGDCIEEDVGGDIPLVGDRRLEDALNDYLQEKDDEIFMHGMKDNKLPDDGDDSVLSKGCGGGSGFRALVGTKMVPLKDLDLVLDQKKKEDEANRASMGDAQNPSANGNEDEKVEDLIIESSTVPVEVLISTARARLARPAQAPPPEEIQIDGQSYFSRKEPNPWDCESILSTYSNLDNNPAIIQHTSRRKKKNKKKNDSSSSVFDGEDASSSGPIRPIRLSQKTGLPLPMRSFDDNRVDDDTTVGGDDADDDDGRSINRGIARDRDETLEQKKLRKAMIKEERKYARIRKKVSKEIYNEEYQKRTCGVGNNNSSNNGRHDVDGKTVFRYS